MSETTRIKVYSAECQTVIPTFTNGNLQKESHDLLKFYKFHPRDSTEKNSILVTETDRLTYVGKSHTSLLPQLRKFYVGVLNKQKGKLRVYPTEMYNMRPKVTESSDEEEPQAAEKSFKEKKDVLTLAFGNQKKKTKLDQRIKNVISKDDLNKVISDVTTKVNENTITIQKDSEENSESVNILPPYDTGASQVVDFYKMNDLLSSEEIDCLRTNATELSEASQEDLKKWKSDNKFCQIVYRHSSFLPSSDERRMQKACILTYLQYLANLVQLKTYEFTNKKNPFPETVPKQIQLKMIREFTEKKGSSKNEYSFSGRMKDKAIIYFIIICLHLDNFQTDLEDIQFSLQIPPKRLRPICNAIGCKFKKVNSVHFITLSLPVKFPESSINKKPLRKRK